MSFKIPISAEEDIIALYDEELQSASGNNLLLDLTHCQFLNPIMIISLAMFIIKSKNNRNKVTVRLPSSSTVKKYLSDIKLREFCLSNYETSVPLGKGNRKTAMPIGRLSREHMESYSMEAMELFEGYCPGKDLTSFKLGIDELINNVYDHAQSDIDAYIFSQIYPFKNEITLVVGDYGIGIPTAIKRYFERNNRPVPTDEQCIEWALGPNNSIQSIPQNRGKGLNNILSSVQASGSTLRIYSGSAMYMWNPFSERYDENPYSNFIGTIIEVVLNIRGLPELEEVEAGDLW